MSDYEGYVQIPDAPDPEEPYDYPMTYDWPEIDDGRARRHAELEHFSNEQGAKLGLVCREPMRIDPMGMNVRRGI